MNKEDLEARKVETEKSLQTLGQQVQQLDGIRRKTYENFLRMQGQLTVLNELLAPGEIKVESS